MLPALNRLRLRRDFTTVYNQGDRHHGKYLKLRVYNINMQAQSQLGIVVSKKVSKKAVTRNRIRRQIRAIFRAFLPQLKQGFQIVITVVMVSEIPSYLQLQEDLIYLLNRSQVLYSN